MGRRKPSELVCAQHHAVDGRKRSELAHPAGLLNQGWPQRTVSRWGHFYSLRFAMAGLPFVGSRTDDLRWWPINWSPAVPPQVAGGILRETAAPVRTTGAAVIPGPRAQNATPSGSFSANQASAASPWAAGSAGLTWRTGTQPSQRGAHRREAQGGLKRYPRSARELFASTVIVDGAIRINKRSLFLRSTHAALHEMLGLDRALVLDPKLKPALYGELLASHKLLSLRCLGLRRGRSNHQSSNEDRSNHFLPLLGQ
jgi:hypothetical protein